MTSATQMPAKVPVKILCPLLLAAAWSVAPPASAQDIYKCKSSGDQLVYQDHPCAGGAKDAGLVKGGYAAPLSNSGEASAHYQNLLNQADQDHAQQQTDRSRLDAEERQPQANPPPMQADQADYRRNICQAQLDTALTGGHLANFSCDAQGNKIPVQPAVLIER